jgi:hypothetical protein
VFPNSNVGEDTDIVSQPGAIANIDGSNLDFLLLQRPPDISGLSGIVGDASIGGYPHIFSNDNLVEGADDGPFGDVRVFSDEQDAFFGMLVSWMDIDVRIPFDSDVIADVNIPRPVDHHSGFDIDIFAVGSKKKSIF